MHSKDRFRSLENMCRERVAHARREMEYWLAEAEEWKDLKDLSDPLEVTANRSSDLANSNSA
jgi:hypothetical protein